MSAGVADEDGVRTPTGSVDGPIRWLQGPVLARSIESRWYTMPAGQPASIRPSHRKVALT
jgi:hypothetical protein